MKAQGMSKLYCCAVQVPHTVWTCSCPSRKGVGFNPLKILMSSLIGAQRLPAALWQAVGRQQGEEMNREKCDLWRPVVST
jgi:hypothetical protein